MRIRHVGFLALGLAAVGAAQTANGQANLAFYTDNLVNAFQNWSWATVNLANSSPTHAGTGSISVVNAGNYQALYLQHPNFNTTPYASLSFWINGGATGGQTLSVHGIANGSSVGNYNIGPLAANTWTNYIIPLSSLSIANAANCSGIQIQGGSAAQPVFYVDDVQFVAAPAPALVHLNVDASQTVRTVDSRLFGVNDATWDSYIGSATATTISLMKQAGITTLRWPGVSTSDGYHWYNDAANNNTFNQLATNLGANVFITVNYGSGTSNEAAAWVKSVNVTNHYGFKYWEIGNECYGTWKLIPTPTAVLWPTTLIPMPSARPATSP
jgi:alpha-N-arabinofuranosidase